MWNQRGQILPLFAVFFLLTYGIFLISLNVGLMAERRIQLQVAADSAAMTGARFQALALGFMANTNDMIIAHAIRFLADLASLENPESWVNLIEEIERIEKLKSIQDGMFFASAAAAEAAPLMMSAMNGADFTFPFPVWADEVHVPQLKVQRAWWTLFLLETREAPALGLFQVPCVVPYEIEEKITAFAVRKASPMVGGDFLGFEFPTMTAAASAQPYWILAEPRSGELDKCLDLVSMVLPGPFWSSRLVETGGFEDMAGKITEGTAKAFLQVVLDKGSEQIAEKIWSTEEGWLVKALWQRSAAKMATAMAEEGTEMENFAAQEDEEFTLVDE